MSAENTSLSQQAEPATMEEIRPDVIRGISLHRADEHTHQRIGFALDDAVTSAGKDGVASTVDAVFTAAMGAEIGQVFETAFTSFLSGVDVPPGGGETFSTTQIRSVLTNAINGISDAQYQALSEANGGELRSWELSNMIKTSAHELNLALSNLAGPEGAVYRFFNSESGSHFYTTSVEERDDIVANLPHLLLEGPVFITEGLGTALHRFYNTLTDAHFFTTAEEEKAYVEASFPQFAYEGVAMYVYTDATGSSDQGVFRLYNEQTGKHLFTASQAEADNVQNVLGWKLESSNAFYVEIA
ncbi:hypothetical protein [Roseibium alexandrii]|uniref:DUF5648 domain-containing protein n=1 Tax=Roseibium alexandrii TaxID=388408 RepID=A0A0M6ZZ39_9HYPH|nr:hypothetical protein [Roseibium alexandrii]CTQ67442.1 hypothetical protein LAX5112_01393 [Roseibium alexandrii]